MAGLDPAIHCSVEVHCKRRKTWIIGTSPVMTIVSWKIVWLVARGAKRNAEEADCAALDLLGSI
jgi:hypothetical protein